jgi:7-cyano-7-deazaguanine reductase
VTKLPSRQLETFPNPRLGRRYEIVFDCPEFTCVCPRTGQPDFATIRIRYVPDELCVELKSLKLYLWSYRDQGAFHEAVTNAILDDLVTRLDMFLGQNRLAGCNPANQRQPELIAQRILEPYAA